jgi:DNA-binding transcriptional LysR family regulator
MNRIDDRRLDLNLLFVFQALLSERHVGRAAQRLALTQSAASHALRRLRAMFGDPLFVRHPKGVEPTARALALAPRIAEMLDSARAMLTPFDGFDPRQARSYTIATIDHTVHTVLAPLIGRLRSLAPAIDLRVRRLDRRRIVAALDRHEVDIALMNDFALLSYLDAPARVLRRPLLTDRFVGIARRGHRGLAVKPLMPEAYADLPHLLISIRGDAVGFVDPLLAQLGLKRRIVMTVPHVMAAPPLVAASDLVTLIGERIARRAAAELDLMLFDPPLPIPGFTIDLVTSVARANDPGLRWLCDQIVEVCGGPKPVSGGEPARVMKPSRARSGVTSCRSGCRR